jgi:S-layer homology domain
MLAGVFLALVSFGPATTGFAQGTTRQQMTLALAQALNISQIPACVAGQEMFKDVPASSPFCPFIEELSRRGITGGCGSGNFCPGDPVTRQQMAVFLVKGIFPEPFHEVGAGGEPPFENGWHNQAPAVETTAAFYKDPSGVVHLKGIVVSAELETDIFHLPPGYRVTKGACIATVYNSYVCFFPDGAVRHSGTIGTVTLDGMTFLAGSG